MGKCHSCVISTRSHAVRCKRKVKRLWFYQTKQKIPLMSSFILIKMLFLIFLKELFNITFSNIFQKCLILWDKIKKINNSSSFKQWFLTVPTCDMCVQYIFPFWSRLVYTSVLLCSSMPDRQLHPYCSLKELAFCVSEWVECIAPGIQRGACGRGGRAAQTGCQRRCSNQGQFDTHTHTHTRTEPPARGDVCICVWYHMVFSAPVSMFTLGIKSI